MTQTAAKHGLPHRALCAVLALLCCLALALPARAADLEALAPYAEEGDFDYVPEYDVTVELREDGSADITYDITWQVIAGDKTDYLSWVKIGLPNRWAEELTPLTDTIADLQYSDDDGGSYAKVVLARRYYEPDYAAATGAESRVRFAFRVHQTHLFTVNDDGTANFQFTPGWFDDLTVEHLQVRWQTADGFVADTDVVEDGYLVWDFGPLAHGESASVHVTVPVTTSESFDPELALTADAPEGDTVWDILAMAVFVAVFVGLFVWFCVFLYRLRHPPVWGWGFGTDEDDDDWFWYTNGVHFIRRAPDAPPPHGYSRCDAPPAAKSGFKAGGGTTRGGGAGRRSSGSSHSSGCASSCACACASSCACACACAGGGRAGCTAKDFYTVKLKITPEGEKTDEH